MCRLVGLAVVSDDALLDLRNSGISINPAPCADAMMKDHRVRSPNPTRMPTQLGCRDRKRRYNPNANRIAAAPNFRVEWGRLIRATRTAAPIIPMESATP